MSVLRLNDKYNFGLRKLLPEFRHNGKKVSLGDEIVIQVGQGTTEYMSFGDLAIDSLGKLHLFYRQASGHNDAPNGTVRYRTSTTGGATWTDPVTVIPDTSDAFNITNPAITITSTGRMLLFYTKQDWPTSTLTQLTYLIYSDDGGSTWNSNGNDGNEILITNDIAYINIIGHAVEMEGVLMLPVYSRVSVTSGNEYVLIYQSTDNGVTWTLRSQVTDGTSASLLNAGETSLLIRQDNVIITNMRGSTVPIGNYSTFSLDGGLTWYPKPYRIGNTRSKNPMAASPNGTILTCARNYITSYTMYGYSADGGQTFTYERLDDREGMHEYSGIVWDRFNNRWVIVYYVETGVTTDSPTDIVCRFVYEVPDPEPHIEPTIFRMLVIGDSIARGTSDGSGQAGQYRTGLLREYTSGAHLSEVAYEVVDAVTGSPYPSFANTLFTLGKKITHVVNCGVGGAEFSPNGDTNNWSTSGIRYAAMSTKANNYLATQLPGTTFDVIRITLGVNDAVGSADLATINTDAISLIDRLTTDYPSARIVINQLGRSSATSERTASVRATIASLVSTYANVYAGTDLNTYPADAFYDGLHLTQEYNNQLGEDDAVIINGM